MFLGLFILSNLQAFREICKTYPKLSQKYPNSRKIEGKLTKTVMESQGIVMEKIVATLWMCATVSLRAGNP